MSISRDSSVQVSARHILCPDFSVISLQKKTKVQVVKLLQLIESFAAAATAAITAAVAAALNPLNPFPEKTACQNAQLARAHILEQAQKCAGRGGGARRCGERAHLAGGNGDLSPVEEEARGGGRRSDDTMQTPS